MKKRHQKSKPTNKSSQPAEDGTDLRIDTQYLVTRLRALTSHASSVEGEKSAEINAREISTHLKNIKELQALNKAIEEQRTKKAFTRYENLPAPHSDDIAAFRQRLRKLVSKHS